MILWCKGEKNMLSKFYSTSSILCLEYELKGSDTTFVGFIFSFYQFTIKFAIWKSYTTDYEDLCMKMEIIEISK